MLIKHLQQDIYTSIVLRDVSKKYSRSYCDLLKEAIYLKTLNHIDLQFIGYHNCCENYINFSPLGEGFPDLPFTCPFCNQSINSLDELTFDFLVEFLQVP